MPIDIATANARSATLYWTGDDMLSTATRVAIVTIAALVASRPGHPNHLVRDRAMATLYRYLNPLLGGPDGNGWGFDQHLNAASVFQTLEAVEGIDRVEEVLFFEYDLRNQERLGFGKELVKLERDSLFLSANHQVVVR